MGKDLEWFGKDGKDGVEVVKMAGAAIVTVGAIVITGAVLGTVGNMINGGGGAK